MPSRGGCVRLTRGITGAGWSMERQSLTPEFTTRWSDLPAAH
ncbi:MAG: DUF4113 domain-containing protein [Halopseudomonas aestusnigri]|nr:DUF4113 domain-containing protein [Halopseudomonas aestusnigri]